jgi:hypothetical protein
MNAPLPAAVLDHALAREQIDAQWDRDIVARLSDYIAIPAKSPLFDPQWAAHGHIETVVRQCRRLGAGAESARLVARGRASARAHAGDFFRGRRHPSAAGAHATQTTVLMYGHLDKQPEFNGWRNDLGPWTPEIRRRQALRPRRCRRRLCGLRQHCGACSAQGQGVAHPRIVGLIETCEESGSYDLLPYVDALKDAPGRCRPR